MGLGAIASRLPRTALISSNNPKLLLLLPPPLLELHPPKDQMLGLNTPHTGLHTVMMSMILNVSFHSSVSSQANGQSKLGRRLRSRAEKHLLLHSLLAEGLNMFEVGNIEINVR
jgi:hypothetical protein